MPRIDPPRWRISVSVLKRDIMPLGDEKQRSRTSEKIILPPIIASPPIHFPDSLSFPIHFIHSPAAGLAALPLGGAQKHSLPDGGAQKHLRRTYVSVSAFTPAQPALCD